MARASRAQGKSLATKAENAKLSDDGKGSKRGPQSSGRVPSKRCKVFVAESADIHAQDVTSCHRCGFGGEIVQVQLNTSESHGPAFTHGARQNLAICETGGKPIDSLILNDSFSDMLAPEKSMLRKRFQKFARKASIIFTISLLHCGLQSPQL